MRQSTLVFREATGTFYYDRWKPLFEGATNILISICLVQWIGVIGAILSTVITNLVICHVIEPYVLYKHAFCSSPRKYYFKNYLMIALFVVALGVMYLCKQRYDSYWTELFVNGFISVGISFAVCAAWVLLDRGAARTVIDRLKSRIKAK
jgi:hypothetical protein